MDDQTDTIVDVTRNARERLVELLARVSAGDQAALGHVYDMTSGKLTALLIRILRDRSAADDVLQEVYIAIWRRSSTFDHTKASPITWLVTIARNKAIDRLRSSKIESTSFELVDEALLSDSEASIVDRLEQAEERAQLFVCLDQLESRAQGHIRAAFFDGMTYEALAVREGVPIGTMKSWIRRGLLRLRACLDT